MKNKKNFKLAGSALIALVLILLAVFPGGELLEDKFSSRNFLDKQNIWGMYDLKKNSVDVCITGSSQVMSGVASPELYKEYGITAYSLGTCSQPVVGAYYQFKEFLERQNPKVLIYEPSGLFYEKGNKGSLAKAFFELKNTSKNKFDGVKEITDGDFEEMLGYYWGMYRYHDRWNELSKPDYVFPHKSYEKSYLGYAVNQGIYKNNHTRDDYIVSYTQNKIELPEAEYVTYLKKMKELCDERGIKMLMVKIPREDWTSGEYSTIVDVAADLGIEYVDMNTSKIFDTLSLHPVNDILDYKHLNYKGAKKVTDYIGEYLKDNFILEDHRNTGHSYDKIIRDYDHIMKGVAFSEIDSFSQVGEYLLNEKKYSYTLVKRGEVNFSEEDINVLNIMGIKTPIENMDNFVFIKHKGKVKEEINLKGKADVRGFTLKGDFYFAEIESKKITAKFGDASETAELEDALILTVLDNESGFEVCSFTFDSELNAV